MHTHDPLLTPPPDEHRWALRSVENFLPTLTVRGAPGGGRPIPQGSADLAPVAVRDSSRGDTTVGDVLNATDTEAWLVLHEGVLVDEQYRRGMAPGTSHMLMSVTKSVVGIVTGILCEQGRLAPDDELTRHVPELASSGYRGATVRNVLDMRSGIRFAEDYVDPAADVRRMEAAIGWRPGVVGVHPGLHRFLCELPAERAHGGAFDYRSCETDVLGWVCERASGASMADLISTLVWQPIGAERDAVLLCDSFGAGVHDGGLAAAARDVARFGQLLLDGGTVEGVQVAPRGWLADIWSVNGEVRRAFADSPAEAALPGGWYRSQFWVVPGPHGDLLLCLGIYGQLIRIDPATRTVMVKLSSWAAPQNPVHLFDTMLACDAVADALSGRTGRLGPRFGPPPGRGVLAGRVAHVGEFGGFGGDGG